MGSSRRSAFFFVDSVFPHTFERLNKSCITQPRESFCNIIDDLGSNLSSVIKAKVDCGEEMRITLDNFDVRILVNGILCNHGNSDVHWIANYVTLILTEYYIQPSS